MHGTHGKLVNTSTCGSRDGGILLVLQERYRDFYSPKQVGTLQQLWKSRKFDEDSLQSMESRNNREASRCQLEAHQHILATKQRYYYLFLLVSELSNPQPFGTIDTAADSIMAHLFAIAYAT